MAVAPTVGNTFGVAFIGLVASAVIYGLTLLQTFHYYRRYPRDPLQLKWIVGILTLADSIHIILSTAAVYWYLIANFGNFENLGITHWAINLQTDFNGFVSAGVQLFFTRRIYQLSKNKYLLVILLTLTAIYFFFGVYFTVHAFEFRHFSDYKLIIWVPAIGIGSAAVIDAIIATSMVYFLRRSRTGFGRTDTLITTLMMYSINTGLLSSIFASASAILYATMPDNLIWLCIFWMHGKLYVNSFLAMLNSRESLRLLVSQPNSFELSDIHNASKRVSRAQAASTVEEVYRYPDEMPPHQQQLEVMASNGVEQSKCSSFPVFNHHDPTSSKATAV
ncbi:hypothetical protein BD410DRAFT_749441 [Rickenella mellea]|uniref:DUF6534 domain-containing protein n=1 Tax=Rickenella mellea TaxID=50990 RepID=A0A4Y7Q477_9AGAM|nr:hypothetical protein BD410DRAFT_749441 [Rickenella mellea]